MSLDPRIEEHLLNPPPGSKAAAAKEFGVDLTLLIRRLKMSPEERIQELDEFVDAIEHVRQQNPQLRQSNNETI